MLIFALFENSRWLRLLFGREYQLMDLLMVWDALFAEGEHLELTHYIVVAMLIGIRDQREFPHSRDHRLH